MPHDERADLQPGAELFTNVQASCGLPSPPSQDGTSLVTAFLAALVTPDRAAGAHALHQAADLSPSFLAQLVHRTDHHAGM